MQSWSSNTIISYHQELLSVHRLSPSYGFLSLFLPFGQNFCDDIQSVLSLQCLSIISSYLLFTTLNASTIGLYHSWSWKSYVNVNINQTLSNIILLPIKLVLNSKMFHLNLNKFTCIIPSIHFQINLSHTFIMA